MNALKIRATSPSPRDWRCWLNDMEITSGLTGLSLSLDIDDVSQIELRMSVDGLDVDAETLAVLEAHVRERVT